MYWGTVGILLLGTWLGFGGSCFFRHHLARLCFHVLLHVHRILCHVEMVGIAVGCTVGAAVLGCCFVGWVAGTVVGVVGTAVGVAVKAIAAAEAAAGPHLLVAVEFAY